MLVAGPLDLAAHLLGGYQPAMKFIAREFAPRVRRWDAQGLDMVIARTSLAGHQRRALLQFFLDCRNAEEQELFHIGPLNELLGSWGYKRATADYTAFALGQSRLNRLMELLETFQPDHLKFDGRHALVIPWFHKHHAISMLSLYDPNNKKQGIVNIRVHPCRYAFSGLLNSRPDASTTWLTYHFAQAMRGSSHLQLDTTSDSCLGVFVDRNCETIGFMPDNACYLLQTDEQPSIASRLAHDRPDYVFASGAPGDPVHGQSWPDYVTTRLFHWLEASPQHKLPPAAKIFAQAAELPLPARQKLLLHMEARNYHLAAKDLERVFQTTVIYHDSKLRVLETPKGYQAVRAKNPLRETITNFTIHLTQNVLFEDKGEIFHNGYMLFAGAQYPVMLGIDDIENGASLQKRVQEAFIRSTAGHRPPALPVIRDKTLLKTISLCLRESVAALSAVNGVASLGWHHSRQRYTSPRWILGADGLQEGPFAMHPQIPALAFFQSQGFKTLTSLPFVPPAGLADLGRMILAGIAREFLNMRMEGVPIRQDRHTQRVVELLFQRFGQVRPINFNGPPPDGVQRFPVFGYGYRPQNLRNSDFFVFGLGDHGMPLHDLEEVTDEQAVVFADWLDAQMRQIIEHLLIHGGQDLERVPRILYTNELLSEGDAIFRNILGYSDLPSKPVLFEAVEQLLQDMGSTDKIPKMFAYDHQNQVVRIYHSENKRVSPVDLETELRRLSPVVEVHPTYMSVAPTVAYSVLQHYFGATDVRIPQMSDR